MPTQTRERKQATGRGKDFPVVKVAVATVIIGGGIAGAYHLGWFKKKPKKLKCKVDELSTWTDEDGSWRFSPDKYAAQINSKLRGVNWITGAGTPYYKRRRHSSCRRRIIKCLQK